MKLAPGLRLRLEPHLQRHRLAAVAGVAGDAGFGHVRLPVGVDVLRHLDHAPRDDLGVLGVVAHVRRVVAVVAALLRRHPFGDRGHVARELGHAQVAQLRHVLVDVPGLRARVAGRRLGDRRRLVGRGHAHLGARVVDQFHAGAAVAALHGVDRRAFAAGQQGDRGQQRDPCGCQRALMASLPAAAWPGRRPAGRPADTVARRHVSPPTGTSCRPPCR